MRVGLIYPELLGTYGDRGNALVLTQRCRRREIPAELVEVAAGTPIPADLDIYLFGGGEDDPQVMASDGMLGSRAAIDEARAGGAVVFAVCAGFQLLGHTYEARDGQVLEGLGIVDMVTTAGPDRLIGEVIVEPDSASGLPLLTGFENHGGRTSLAANERPLGYTLVGGGNGEGVDGVFGARLIGTYMHGPVLPRNPALADLLLGWVLGTESLPPLSDRLPIALRAERIQEATFTGWRARMRDWKIARG